MTDSLFNGIISKFDSLIHIYRNKGQSAVIRAILRKLGFSIVEKVNFFFLDLSSFPDIYSNNVDFRIYNYQQIKNQERYIDGFNSKFQALNKINKGALLFVYEIDEKPVYFVWIQQRKISIDYFIFDLPNDIVFLSNEYVRPEFRKMGIAKKERLQIFHHLKQSGIKFIILVINPKNEAAIKLNKSCGFQEYQTLSYRSFLYFRYYEVKSTNKNQGKKFISFYRPIRDIWKIYANFYKL